MKTNKKAEFCQFGGLGGGGPKMAVVVAQFTISSSLHPLPPKVGFKTAALHWQSCVVIMTVGTDR